MKTLEEEIRDTKPMESYYNALAGRHSSAWQEYKWGMFVSMLFWTTNEL